MSVTLFVDLPTSKEQLATTAGTPGQVVCRCIAALLLSTLSALSITAAQAKDRLDAGTASFGLSWVTESPTESGWEAKMKVAVTPDLEVALSTSTIRDTSETPLIKINGVGLEVSWWPLSLSEDVTMGISVTLSDGEKSVSNGRDVTLMLEGELDIFQYQWDVGYDYSRNGAERESTWGTAFSVQTDLTQRSELEIELSQNASEKPGIELGYEYDAWKNLELKFSVGRAEKTTYYAIGFEYKF